MRKLSEAEKAELQKKLAEQRQQSTKFADQCFKTDSEGRTIFYRGRLFWGVKGYIVPDEFRKQQIH